MPAGSKRKGATVNPVPRIYVRGFRACPSGTSEHSPREIAARGAFKVMTEEIISRGSSLHLRTGRSVVRGKFQSGLFLVSSLISYGKRHPLY